MNNKEDKKSIIVFRRGRNSFLIYGVFLMLVVIMTVIDLLMANYKPVYNPVYDKIGIIVVSILLGLSIISFILALVAISSASQAGLNTYFAKLGLTYGIFTIVIWGFLGFCFIAYLSAIVNPPRSHFEEKIIFFIILSILSLAPLILHIWFRTKFGKSS